MGVKIVIEDGFVTSGGDSIIGAAHSHNADPLRIVFSNVTGETSWDDLSKIAIWQNSHGQNTVYTIITANMAAEGIAGHSITATYAVGDLVTHSGNTYICIAAVETAGAWSDSNWQLCYVYDVPVPIEPLEYSGKMRFAVKGFQTAELVETTAVYTAMTELVVEPTVYDAETWYKEAEEKTASIAEQLIDGKVDKVDDYGLVRIEEITTDDPYYFTISQSEGSEAAVYSTETVDNLLDEKVDKVSGYGLVDVTLGTGTATITEKGSPDVSTTVYTKDKTDDLLAPKADTSDVNTALAGKVDKVTGYGLVSITYDSGERTYTIAQKSGSIFLPNVIVRDAEYIDGAYSLLEEGKADKTTVNDISAKIPDQASSSNKLADKAFVNSSIATETAHYISDNGDPFTSTSDLPTSNVTNNDYAFVTGTDSDGNTYYDRYKASVSGTTVTWAKEYRLNNSSFTAAQWASIESGITAALVTQIGTNTTALASKLEGVQLNGTDLTVSNKKVNITVDSSPTYNSTNPVQSGGVYTALARKLGVVHGTESQIDTYKPENPTLYVIDAVDIYYIWAFYNTQIRFSDDGISQRMYADHAWSEWVSYQDSLNGISIISTLNVSGTANGQVAFCLADGYLYSWDATEQSWDILAHQYQNAQETAYGNADSPLTSTDVQDAIDELANATMPVVTTSSQVAVDVALVNNADYRCGVVSDSIEVTLPLSISGAFCSCVRFTTPSTIPTDYSTFPNINYVGDDTANGVFTPVENKRYTMLFDYDGDAVNCYVYGRTVTSS